MHQLERIILDYNELNGHIGNILSCCVDKSCAKSMEMFSSVNNPLTGTIPPEISACTSLKEFDLVRSDVYGGVPTEFGLLTELLDLDLSMNRYLGIESPEKNAAQENITTSFHPEDSKGTALPSELGYLTKLEALHRSEMRHLI